MSAGLRAYRKAATDLAPPHERALAAHERAIDCLRQAMRARGQGDLALHKALLCRGLGLVGALPAELDVERGGELAGRLVDLYAYMGARLGEANARGDAAPIGEVVALLDTLARGLRAAAPGAPPA